MVQPNNDNKTTALPQQIEQEIRRQMEEMDKRLDRSGWLYLVLALVALFIFLYFFMVLNPSSDEAYDSSYQALVEQVDQLDNQVESLQNQVDQLLEKQAEE